MPSIDQRITRLEQELHEARENKYNLEHSLDMYAEGANTAEYHQDMAKYEEIYTLTNEKIQQLTETKEALLKQLDEAKAAADSIDALNEEIAATANVAAIKQDALDEVMMSIHLLEEKLNDLENSQGLLQQEFELARINEEYVGGLQKKIDNTTENVDALNVDLREATNRKYSCEQNLFNVLKVQQRLEIRLENAQIKAESIIPVEYKLMELGEIIAEEQSKLEVHAEYISQLHEAIAQQGSVNESHGAELEMYNSRIEALSAELVEARAQLDKMLSEESQLSETVVNALNAVGQCTQYNEIYRLEETFNAVGMTLQKTLNDRIILCRCEDNKIVTENVIDDFIFVGPAKRLHEGVIDKIKSFILANQGAACTPTHEPIGIVNEDKKLSLDFLVEAAGPWGGFREPEPKQSVPMEPDVMCPRCSEQTVIQAQGGYNCTACGWRGRNPSPIQY